MSFQPVVIAKIGAPHGVKGALKLHVFMENPSAVLDLDLKEIQIEDRPNCFLPLGKCRIFEKGGAFFIEFSDYLDRDLARRFVNKTLAVDRSKLPDVSEGEFYWTDLEGLTVHNQQGIILGVVDHLFETGSNDVLVVKKSIGPQVREMLIPYVDAHILKVDLDQKIITVDWDENF